MVHLQTQTTVFAYFSSANSNAIINSQVIKMTRIRIFNVKVTKFDSHSVSHFHTDLPFTDGAVGIGLWVVYRRKGSTFRAQDSVSTSITLLGSDVLEQQEQDK